MDGVLDTTLGKTFRVATLLEAKAGTTFASVAEESLLIRDLSEAFQPQLRILFNDIVVSVEPNDTVETLCVKYEHKQAHG